MRGLSVAAAVAGIAGGSLLVLTPVSALAFTSWQLTAGGLLLLPARRPL